MSWSRATHGALEAEAEIAVIDQLLHALFLEQAVDEGHFLRQRIVENDAADGGVEELTLQLHRLGVRDVLVVVGGGQVDHLARIAQADGGEQFDFTGFKRQDNFFDRAERAALALGSRLGLGEVVDAEHHVLRRNGERQAVGGRENVARGKHQHGGFDLRLGRQRNVHSHLVAVEIGVERGADEGMDANGLALDEGGFEGLNAQAVQRGRAVEQDGMFANDFFEDVPDDGFLLLDHLLGLLDGGAVAGGFELVIDERLEKLEGHFLRQAALIEAQLGADDNDGAAGIIDALAEEVLAEAALLALQGVGQRLERAIVGAAQHAAAAAVIE